jgi:hypothetical protein
MSDVISDISYNPIYFRGSVVRSRCFALLNACLLMSCTEIFTALARQEVIFSASPDKPFLTWFSLNFLYQLASVTKGLQQIISHHKS